MSLIVPHRITIQRHAQIPYLWRVRCICGFVAFAPAEWKAKACATSHIEAEEAFPDYSFLGEPPEQFQ